MQDLPDNWDIDALEMKAYNGDEPGYAARALTDAAEFYRDMRVGHTENTALHLAVNYLRRKRPSLGYWDALDLLSPECVMHKADL